MKKLIAIAALAVFALPLCAATAASDMVTADDVADDLLVDENNGLEVKVDAPRKNVEKSAFFFIIAWMSRKGQVEIIGLSELILSARGGIARIV